MIRLVSATAVALLIAAPAVGQAPGSSGWVPPPTGGVGPGASLGGIDNGLYSPGIGSGGTIGLGTGAGGSGPGTGSSGLGGGVGTGVASPEVAPGGPVGGVVRNGMRVRIPSIPGDTGGSAQPGARPGPAPGTGIGSPAIGGR